MGSAKANALAMIEGMPDDCTWEDVEYLVYVRSQVEKGFAEIDAGLGIPHDEAVKEMRGWRASHGPRTASPAPGTSTTESPVTRS